MSQFFVDLPTKIFLVTKFPKAFVKTAETMASVNCIRGSYHGH